MTPKESAFIASVAPGAQAAAAQYGVPASATIAQAILETGWGKGVPPGSNNYFGIKALSGQAAVTAGTTEYVNGARVGVEASFAAYPDVASGFAAHARLLSRDPRYAPAMAERANPAEFCSQLQACGYSTSPIYSEQLLELINEFNLTQYDTEAA
jgi:flagellum-specific peptidoglycan hydrolase FlgJ